jgi:predicted acetyltransferase
MTQSMGFEVHHATLDDRPALETLLELYLNEFSEIVVSEVDLTAWLGDIDLPSYWVTEGRYPYLATVDGKLAGFALVQRGSMITARGDLWDMQHFFVMRKYRHRGLGSDLARRVWCEHPGPWEVRVVENNDAALRFWSNVVKREFPAKAIPVVARGRGKTYQVFRFEAHLASP